jgi:hypothetical protein
MLEAAAEVRLMGFVLVQTWLTPNEYKVTVGPAGLLTKALPFIPENYFDLQLRRIAAWSCAVIVHLILAWLVLSRFGQDFGDGVTRPSEAIAIFNLIGPSSAADDSSRKSEIPASPNIVETKVDAAVDVGLLPPEWMVSRIRVPVTAPALPPAPPVEAGRQAGAATGGGGQGYDPYAGASPMRLPPGAGAPPAADAGVIARISGASAGEVRLAQADVERVRVVLRRRDPKVRGTVNVEVRMSADGVIVEARPVGGSAPLSTKHLLCTLLVGRRLTGKLSVNSFVRLSPITI